MSLRSTLTRIRHAIFGKPITHEQAQAMQRADLGNHRNSAENDAREILVRPAAHLVVVEAGHDGPHRCTLPHGQHQPGRSIRRNPELQRLGPPDVVDDLGDALQHLVLLGEIRRCELRRPQRVDADLAHEEHPDAVVQRDVEHALHDAERVRGGVVETTLALELRDAPPHRLDPLPRDAAGEFEEQLVLRLEVGVERTARVARALADRLDGCRVKAHLGEDLGGGIQEPLARGLATARCHGDGV